MSEGGYKAFASSHNRNLFDMRKIPFAAVEFSDDDDEGDKEGFIAPRSFSFLSVSRNLFCSRHRPFTNTSTPIEVKHSSVVRSLIVPPFGEASSRALRDMHMPSWKLNDPIITSSLKQPAITKQAQTKDLPFYKPHNSVLAKTKDQQEKEKYMKVLAELAPNQYSHGTIGKKRRVLINSRKPYPEPEIIATISLDDEDDFRPIRTKLPDISKMSRFCGVLPVNSLRDRIDSDSTFNKDWVAIYKQSSRKSELLRNKEIQKTELEIQKISKQRETEGKIIEERLRDFEISPAIIEIDDVSADEDDVEEVSVEFCSLEKRKLDGIVRGPLEEVLISKFRQNITRRDIYTLVGNNWLNDEVINFYMNLIIQRGETRSAEGLPRVYAMNTFFIPRLTQSGFNGVRRWTKKVDLFACELICVPVHVGGVHWCMAIIDLKQKTLTYYDSLGSPNYQVLSMLEEYLQEEHQDKRGRPLDTTQFVKNNALDIPRQMNGSDCGVFSCMFAEFVTRRKSFTFSQKHMPFFREKMILEIVQGELIS